MRLASDPSALSELSAGPSRGFRLRGSRRVAVAPFHTARRTGGVREPPRTAACTQRRSHGASASRGGGASAPPRPRRCRTPSIARARPDGGPRACGAGSGPTTRASSAGDARTSTSASKSSRSARSEAAPRARARARRAPWTCRTRCSGRSPSRGFYPERNSFGVGRVVRTPCHAVRPVTVRDARAR